MTYVIKDGSTELDKAQEPEKQRLGDFASFADICQALYFYIVYRIYCLSKKMKRC